MNRKAVISKVNNGTAYAVFYDDKAVKAQIFYNDEKNILGNIYVGYVKDIVKNINCAFIEYSNGSKAYLQLSGKLRPVFLNVKNTGKLCQGDRIIIQIKKEASKTKDPVCTTEFELTGKYAVLTHGGSGISFSKKIKDESFKEEISSLLNNIYKNREYGILIRTKSCNTDISNIIDEISSLSSEYEKLISIAGTRPKNYILKEADNPLMTSVKDFYISDKDQIITDIEDIYNQIKDIGLNCSVTLYYDKLLPLYKLYSFESLFDQISSRRVWLKSGGYIVIDYTEAMTVIDVNTGKCDKGKDKEKTFLKINLEAAEEIARQLSLRNISGIIIVDFIDMTENENRKKILDAMKEYAAKDSISTNVIDFTKLNLMEITRKKTRDMVKVRDNIFWIFWIIDKFK